MPHQVANATSLAEAISKRRLAIDASQTGTGKTFTAFEVARLLQQPCLFVAPLSTHKQTWNAAQQFFGDDFEKMFLGITNSEALRSRQCDMLVGRDAAGNRYWKDVEPFASALLVWDEFHRGCSGMDSQLTKLFYAAASRKGGLLAMSATPAMTPLQSRAIAVASGACGSGKMAFERFAIKHGCVRATWFPGHPLQFRGNPRDADKWMTTLRDTLVAHGATFARTLSSEIPSFPETEILPYPCAVDPKEMSCAADALRNLLGSSAVQNAGERMRMRALVESLKAPAVADFTEELRAQGYSPVVFCCFLDTIDKLSRELLRRGLRVSVLTGDTSAQARQEEIEAFQRDDADVFVTQIAAGGVGLSLHAVEGSGKRPRVSVVMPCDNPADFLQAFGRIHRAGGGFTKQFVPVVPKSDEEIIMSRFAAKKAGLEALCRPQPARRAAEAAVA